jgi:hypothetical protein
LQGEVAWVDLQVYLMPRLTSSPPAQARRGEGDSGLQAACSATAKPRPAVRWFKDGVEIPGGASRLYQAGAHTHPVSCKKSRDMYKFMNWKTRAKVVNAYFEYFPARN